jgi:hypothetical protein
MRWPFVLAVCFAMTAVAEAQVELKNDGFQAGGSAAFEGGFAIGEIGASRFVAPEAGRTLQKVVHLFGGGATTTQIITIKVWDDSAGTTAPGMELFSSDFQVTGNDSAFHQADVSSQNIILPAQFRVGIQFKHAGYPSIARDNDGTIAADRNYLLANVSGNFTWFRSQTLGLTGDWIIRAEISAGTGGSPVDAGVAADAPPGTGGGPCAGNSQCPMGQYCDLDQMICTSDCLTSADCGGGTCNSLGQCVGFDGDGGSCGCQGGGRGGAFGLSLLLVLFAVVRRR